MQCQRCGRKNGPKLDPLALPDGFSPKGTKWARSRVMKHRPNSMQRRRSKVSRWAETQAQRKRVLERDDYTCQGCGWDDDAEKLEVHHVSYAEIPEDGVPDSELQTVCGPCNLAERNERMAGGEGGRVGAPRG